MVGAETCLQISVFGLLAVNQVDGSQANVLETVPW
jgi:hypothetical protein